MNPQLPGDEQYTLTAPKERFEELLQFVCSKCRSRFCTIECPVIDIIIPSYEDRENILTIGDNLFSQCVRYGIIRRVESC